MGTQMDREDIICIYDKMPNVRKKVLSRILVGYSTREIANELFEARKDPVSCVTAHLKETYKNYQNYLSNSDSESKRSHLIILFQNGAPNLLARLKIELGGPLTLIPKPRQFTAEISMEYQFQLEKVSIDEIPDLQSKGRIFFNTQDHLPTKLLESWHYADQNSYRKIVNKNGRIVGFFIILFPKHEHMLAFSRGFLIERSLKRSMLISRKEKQTLQENYAYISVVVGEPGAVINNICIILLLAKYLDCMCSYRDIRKLYAMAATNDGHHLMSSLGFYLHTPGVERKDGEDFFETNIEELKCTLFEYLTNNLPQFRRHSYNLDLSNLENWLPT
jgi:hypothetical protein